MPVVDLSISKKEQEKIKLEGINNKIRDEIVEYTKNFKISWLNLGRHLYTVWQDKLYHGWGFEKFEDYTEKELGLKRSICLKLLKAYLFIETDEPLYLEKDFSQNREAVKVPGYEEVGVLRLAKAKKEILAQDYAKLRHEAFEKGAVAADLRRDLTAIMKERKPVDPEEERELRNEQAIKKLITAMESFKKDMESLKLIPVEIIEEVKILKGKLQSQI